ncbi:hypothetical protein HZY83_01625, partial [Gemella sp. GH3]|uniref:hypothetical protein n=1 Tax=unclassified Gemella TaxID=2624949 RepID=UPI0017BD986C
MKKIILRTVMLALLGLLLVMLLVGCVKINLKSNAVYYAKNMPRGEGQEPELIMLIDNLWWVDNPNIEELKYDIDGTRDIIYKNKSFGNIYSYETEYIYIYIYIY